MQRVPKAIWLWGADLVGLDCAVGKLKLTLVVIQKPARLPFTVLGPAFVSPPTSTFRQRIVMEPCMVHGQITVAAVAAGTEGRCDYAIGLVPM
jgi:hypothetical protein